MKQVIRKASEGRESIPTLVSRLMLITILASLICLGYPSNPVSASDRRQTPRKNGIQSHLRKEVRLKKYTETDLMIF